MRRSALLLLAIPLCTLAADLKRALLDPSPAEALELRTSPIQLAQQRRCPTGQVLTNDGFCVPPGVSYCGRGRYCASGNNCMSDGGCAPAGTVYCGGNRYCQPGNLCIPGGCLSRSSERVCSNGTSFCQPGFMCMNDGRCLATSSPRYCGGRRYCDPGYVCAGGGCQPASAPPPQQQPAPGRGPGEGRQGGERRERGEDRQPGEGRRGERQPGGDSPQPEGSPLPPGPVGRQPAPREDPAPPPPAPRQEAPAPPPPPPAATQPPPAPPKPVAPLVVPGAPGGDGRVNGSCEAYYGSMIEMFKSNARQCGISSAKLTRLTDAVLGPTADADFRGILKRSDHPDIFGADGTAAGGPRWNISGNFAKANCKVEVSATTTQESYRECARTYVCALVATGCGRDLARQSTFLTCPAASQQCMAKNPIPQQ